MNVFVINQCSTNKGDRAVLYFLLRELRANGIDNITVSASNPQFWHDKPDFPEVAVRVVPWGWDVSPNTHPGFIGRRFHRLCKVTLPRLIYFALLQNAQLTRERPWYSRFLLQKEFLKALQEADLVISTGGHHLTHINAKSIKTPQTFDMAAALLYGKPLLLWSQSIGPYDFRSPADMSVVSIILSHAKQVLIRDEASEREIRNLGVSLEHVSKTRESVFGLYDVVKSRTKPSKRPNVMGVSVWTGKKHTSQAWEHYTRSFARLIEHAIDATGCSVRFFPMEMQGADRPCIEEIIGRVRKKENCEIVEDFPGTVEHMNAVAQCRVFVGHKTHSQIFALVAATPLLAVAYHKKTEDFMAQFGLEKYCIVDTQLCDEKLIEIFDQINDNLDDISQKQLEVASQMYEQVREDFAQMVSSTFAIVKD